MGLPILFRGPRTISGAGASTFSAQVTAAGREVVIGSGASALGWTAAAAAAQRFVGPAATTFTFGAGATAREAFTGTAAATFRWASDAASDERFVAAAASAFGFVAAAIASETYTGAAASSFTWTAGVAAEERFAGDAASAFGFSPAAFGAAIGPLPAPPLAGVRFVPQRPRPRSIRAESASAFGSSARGRARVLEPHVVRSASHFAAAVTGTAALDLAPLRIALEDEAFLLGIDDQELAPIG